MKTSFLLLLITILSFKTYSQLTPPAALKEYYTDVDFTLTGNLLLENLATETISKHTNILSYSQRHNYLYDADKDENNALNVILMYTAESRDKREYLSGNNSHSPQTFNTEHVYPQSLIENTAKGDLHHLRACDSNINSSRSNNPFADGTGNYSNLGASWFPGDEWKGDVARMILYLNIRYNEPFTEVGSLDLFLKWNVEDPVSSFEKQRNEQILSAQGNRNPFIDNPYLATIIWGGTAAENTWSTLSASETKFNEPKIFPNPTAGNHLFIETKTTTTLEIYNVLGKLIISEIVRMNEKKIDITSLKKGVYLVKIMSQNKTTTQKLIKI